MLEWFGYFLLFFFLTYVLVILIPVSAYLTVKLATYAHYRAKYLFLKRHEGVDENGVE